MLLLHFRPVHLRAHRRLEVALDECSVGSDGLQRARHDPLWLAPPHCRVVALLRIPIRKVFVPIAHHFVHAAAVHHAGQAAHVLYEMTKEPGLWRHYLMINVASSDWFNPKTSFAMAQDLRNVATISNLAKASALIASCGLSDAVERAANPLYRTGINAKSLCYLADTLRTPRRLESGQDFRLQFWRYSWTTKLLALCLRPSETGTDTLLNDRAFEFGENTQHLKHGLAAWGGRIDPLLVQEEIDASGVDFR